MSYEWRTNGNWFYKANKGLSEFGFSVPLPEDGRSIIEHTPAQTAKETDCQLGLGLKYALECNIPPCKQLSDCLDRLWWQVLPLGGVVCSGPAAVRQLGLGLYGMGCPHLGIECLEAQLGKLMTHCVYNSSTRSSNADVIGNTGAGDGGASTTAAIVVQ